jgi:hypothetical protein
MIATDLDLETAGCAMHLISNTDPKEHLNFPDYVNHREWGFYTNISFYYKSTNKITITINMTFRNNCMD